MTERHALTARDIKVAQVLRPLGTKPLSMQQARVASKLLDVHWTSVYRLRRRFLANPVASSVASNARGPKAGRTRLDIQVEDIVDDVLGNWLPRQRELANPLLDLWTEVKRRCNRSKTKPPARSTVARRWARHRDEQAAALAKAPGAQIAPGSLVATRPLEIVQIDHTQSDAFVVDPWFRRTIGRPWLTLAIDVATRCVVGFYLGMERPNAATVALLLSRIALPKAAWLAAIGAEAQWPMQGIPQVLHLDNAAEFKSRALHHSQLQDRSPGRGPRFHARRLLCCSAHPSLLAALPSWNIRRTLRPRSAWRATSRCTVRRSFFKGGLRRYVRLGVTRTRHHLAPAVAVQQSVDRGRRHLLAQLFLVRLLDLGHGQHPASFGALNERRQQLLLLLGAEVLMMPAAAPAQIEDGISLLGPARVQDMHRRGGPAQQLGDLGGRTTQCRPDQHALNALVLCMTTGSLEPLCQSRNSWLVAHDQCLHPRLLEVRGMTSYLIY